MTEPWRRAILVATLGWLFAGAIVPAQTVPTTQRRRVGTPPVIDGPWLRPAASADAAPVWGLADGLRVGLAPLPGPRGLLRVYTPYLGQKPGTIMNFVAVEPIVTGQTDRGFSELEYSQLDGRPGKRFTAMDAPGRMTDASVGPARGSVEQVDGRPALRLYVDVEPYANGAHVYLRLTFRADRPHAVGVATFAYADSKPLAHCIVTATMGNYARLRDLHLASRTVSAGALWPDYRDVNFTPHARFGLDQLVRTPDGGAVVTATPNEASPADAAYDPRTHDHWRYEGRPAVQSWTSRTPDPALQAWVNGRYAYWASDVPVPGGIAFENFEMVTPFKPGVELWFGVDPVDAEPTTRPADGHAPSAK